MTKLLHAALFGAILLYPAHVAAQQYQAWPSNSTAGTVATGNTFQSVLPFNSNRHGCLIQNKSANLMQIYLGAAASATTAASTSLAAGATFNCASPSGLVVADEISLTSTTAADAFVVIKQ